MDIKKILREALANHNQTYRAVDTFIGDKVIFKPEGYYEGISNDKSSSPIYKFDTFWVSDTPEVAASKYVGGAVLGLSSMFRQHTKLVPNKPIFIYQLNGKPDKDISHWSLQDFEYLEEVRFRKPVQGVFIGKVIITKEMVDLFNVFYEIVGRNPDDDWDEEEQTSDIKEKMYEMLENGQFSRYLHSIKPIASI